jgi:glycosyltransferase involved in cell wall biosynthesis
LKLISGRGQHEATGRDTICENAAVESALAGDRTLLSLPAEAIVYTSVFNPNDGRKNWGDILTAFCRALSEREDAVLILKFTSADPTIAMDHVRDTLRRLPPFQCRVLALGGHLEESQYARLIATSTYVVNSSLSEGQCLPLMEFLSNGKPAIAPRNTGMIDYFDAEIGFVVNCSKELCCWPHDARNFFRAHRFRTDWQSLAEAFSASYELKRRNPRRYDDMARAAVARMRDYCSEPVVWEKFARFVEVQLRLQMNQRLPPLGDYTPGTAQFTSPAFAGRG